MGWLYLKRDTVQSVSWYKPFGGTLFLLDTNYSGSMFLRNVGKYFPDSINTDVKNVLYGRPVATLYRLPYTAVYTPGTETRSHYNCVLSTGTQMLSISEHGAYRSLMGTRQGRPLGRPRRRREDNTKMGLQ